MRRGGTLVTVPADESQLARATQILDVDGAVDLDERRTAWGQDGWTGATQPTSAGSAGDKIADGATRAKDTVERAGARIADDVTSGARAGDTGFSGGSARPDMSITGSGGAMDTGTGSGDAAGRRVQTY